MGFRQQRTLHIFSHTTYAIFALALVWIFFLVRLYALQVEDRQVYAVKSEENRIVRLTKLASRGEIVDRYGNLLAASRFSVDLVVPNRRMKVREIADLSTRLAPLLNIRPDRIRDAYSIALRKTYGYQPVPVQQNLSDTEIVRMGESLWRFPQVRLQKRVSRWYPGGSRLAHVLGYVNEVSKEDISHDPDFRMGSVIGRAGIEEILEPYLRGNDGWKWVEVDAQGRIRRDLQDIPSAEPVAGPTAYLTLDMKLSDAFENAFGDSNGFGILMDATTGAIRAIFSRPAFDLNRLMAIDQGYIRQLQTNPDHPFFNRAVQSAFPPGSTFKTVNFIAALESGLANEETHYSCSGRFRMGNRVSECWKEGGHGRISLVPALVHSCNVFFYNLGRELGVDRMAAAGQMFRLGEKTGIILSGEPSGILPTAEWKLRRMKEPWTPGDDINMSIGQGFLLVTPLQQVTLMASLFNGGRILRPYLVEGVRSSFGDTLFEEGVKVRSTVNISENTLEMVRRALREVVSHGTGYRAGHDARYRAYPVEIYGKTGTVQRAGRDAVERAGVEPEDHGWFLCYFEIGDEKFTAVVMKESAGHGGTVAAPVIGRFIAKKLGAPS